MRASTQANSEAFHRSTKQDTTINMRFGMDVTLPTRDIDGREIAAVQFYFGPNDVNAPRHHGVG